MALRLILCPVLDEGLLEGMDYYPASRLVFARDYRIFAQIENFPDEPTGWFGDGQHHIVVPTHSLPDGVRVAEGGDEGFTYITTDSKGCQPIAYALAGDLGKLEVPEDSEDPNKAIVIFVRNIPPDTKVILLWE